MESTLIPHSLRKFHGIQVYSTYTVGFHLESKHSMLIPCQFQVCSRQTLELVQHGIWVEFECIPDMFQVFSRCFPGCSRVEFVWIHVDSRYVPGVFQMFSRLFQGGMWVDSCGFQVCSRCFPDVFLMAS